VVVGGYTASSNLPGTPGGAQSSLVGAYDGFVARLSGDLKTLIQSTYLGGSSYDYIHALAIAANGDVVVGGYTDSTNLPGTSGGAQPSSGGSYDGFVARLSGNLNTLIQSTYLGGSSYDDIQALAIAANGDVVVGGGTASTDLPGTSGGAQPSSGGAYDGFVARLSGNLNTLIQSTYLGGSGTDSIQALAIAANGEVVVGGYTYSTNLPGTSGGAQPSSGGGGYDGFVARLSGDLKTLMQSTYLGGSSSDYITALAIAANGDVVVGGHTLSSNLPGTSGGAQPSSGGSLDGFVARLSGDLTTLIQSTYLGGSSGDYIYALAIAASGDVVVGGTTTSTNLPGTSGGAQPSSGGSYDGFVARLSGDLKAVSPQTISFPAQSPASHSFVAGGSFPVNPLASASSGLPVTYTSSTPGVCTVSGSTVTMVAAGTCTIVASQAGNANWQPAPQVSQSVVLAAAAAVVTPVPTLSQWMLLALSGLLGLLAWRRRAA